MGVACTKCGHGNTEVVDVRTSPKHGGCVRRRRSCHKCGNRWRTYELSDAHIRRIDDLLKSIDGLSKSAAQYKGFK